MQLPARLYVCLFVCMYARSPLQSYVDQRNYVLKALHALGDCADGWCMRVGGAVGCVHPPSCLLPAASGDQHGCRIVASGGASQCTWPDVATAKANCRAWDACRSFWCGDDGTGVEQRTYVARERPCAPSTEPYSLLSRRDVLGSCRHQRQRLFWRALHLSVVR